MKKLGFYYDIGRCIGCKSCQVACKEKNQLPVGSFFRRVETLPAGPDGRLRHFSLACSHCEQPACVEVCPTKAMYKAADGTVQHDDALCISCGRCVHRCPYGAVSLHTVTGYAAKCEACADLRAAGKNPACVQACKTRALRFGPLEELEALYGGEQVRGLTVLPPETETSPGLRIVTGSAIDPEWKPALEDADPTRPAAPEEDREQDESRAAMSGTFLRGERFVILGGGIAGVSAARTIRRLRGDAHIKLVSDEAVLPYSRPMLSKSRYVSFADSRYEVIGEEELKESRIRLVRGRVTRLLPDEHKIELGDGSSLSYDKCIYALGMEAVLPPISGRDKEGVHLLRSVQDLRTLRLDTRLAKRAVVIGGGITGIEAAWELHRAGLRVELVDMAPKLAGRLLDDRTAELLLQQLESAGIQVLLNASIREITGSDSVSGILLEDGRALAADLVLISAGYRSRTKIAEEAGAKAEGGLLTDSCLRTGLPDVWACGDCIALGKSDWMQARCQGETAGRNAAGIEQAFSPVNVSSTLHAAGTSLLCIGDMDSRRQKGSNYLYLVLPADRPAFEINPGTPEMGETHFSVCLQQGQIAGICMLGNLKEMELAETAVRDAWSREAFCLKMQEKGARIL